jgi:8-oxo-dGTP diphosphatase
MKFGQFHLFHESLVLYCRKIKKMYWLIRLTDHRVEKTSMTASIYPDSPGVGVGAFIFHDNRILMIKRGKSPSKGMWSIPGGRLELGETLQEAAEREVFEETGLVVKAGNPVYVFDVVVKDDDGRIKYHYVIADLEAEFVSGELKAGDDADDARWVLHEELADLGVSERTVQLLQDRFGFRGQGNI